MELYTINATPVRVDVDEATNTARLGEYSSRVSEVLASEGIDGFTLEETLGYWQGLAEKSFKITVAAEEKERIIRACEQLRDAYNQDAVMLTLPNNQVQFI